MQSQTYFTFLSIHSTFHHISTTFSSLLLSFLLSRPLCSCHHPHILLFSLSLSVSLSFTFPSHFTLSSPQHFIFQSCDHKHILPFFLFFPFTLHFYLFFFFLHFGHYFPVLSSRCNHPHLSFIPCR